jgi:hypothetical protein
MESSTVLAVVKFSRQLLYAPGFRALRSPFKDRIRRDVFVLVAGADYPEEPARKKG